MKRPIFSVLPTALVLACGTDPSPETTESATETSSATSTSDDSSNEESSTSATTLDASSSSESSGSVDSTGEEGEREYVPEEGVEFVEANGQQFAYFAEGEGPLVLLLHGFPDTPHTFDEVRPALAAAGFRAVSPFMRGYAPSSIPKGDAFDAESLGRDALALIEALGEDQAYVVGHDFGAFAAYSAASLEPERLLGLVTIAIPHPGFFVPDAEFFERASHFIYLAQDDAAELMAADDFAHVDELYGRWSPTWDVPAEETEAVKNAYTAPGSLDAALGYYRASTPVPPPFLQQPIEVNTLTIAGEDDGVMLPEGFEQTEAGFTGGWTLVTLPGGHFVHRESPDAVIAEIVDFVSAAQ